MEQECYVKPVQKAATAQEKEQKISAIFAIWGMGCPRCEVRVQNSLLTIHGVIDAYVDHLAGMAWVVFNPDMVTPDRLIEAVAQAGEGSHHEYTALLLA